METTDVYVTNMNDYTSAISDVSSKLDALSTDLNSVLGYIQNIEIWLMVIVWCIFFLIACFIANWLWKTWIKGLLRQYFKLHLF